MEEAQRSAIVAGLKILTLVNLKTWFQCKITVKKVQPDTQLDIFTETDLHEGDIVLWGETKFNEGDQIYLAAED